MAANDSDAADEPAQPTVRSARGASRPERGRRAFLGLLAAAGVGAGLARWRSADVHTAGGGEVPIVYGFARADPADPRSVEPLSKTVPAEWLRELSRVVAAHRSLPLPELTGFVGSYVVPGDASDPGASISIQASAERLQDEVADLSPDVEFDVEVFDEIPEVTGGSEPLEPEVVADLDDRSVPGGVLCGNGRTHGSLAPALHDPEAGRRFFATANHLYGGDGPDDRGEPLYLFDGTDRAWIGRVRRGFADLDVVLVDPTGVRVPASEIAEGDPRTVGGQFTRLGLADLAARDVPLRMTGAVSGHSTGRIKGIDGVTFYTGEGVRTGQLIWGDEEAFTDGDSGSVNYRVDPQDEDRVLVGGVNSARTWWPGADFTWGTAAYRLREAHGLVF